MNKPIRFTPEIHRKTADFETEPNLVPTNSVDDKSSKEFIGIVPPTAPLFTPASSLGVEDTSIAEKEPVDEKGEVDEKESVDEQEETESEDETEQEEENQPPYFTGYNRMDLTSTPNRPTTLSFSKQPLSVHVCLYRIQTKENNPYLEFVLQKHPSTQQYHFPSVDLGTEGSSSANSAETVLKNNLLTHIEVLLGKTSTDYPLFHGFKTYQDKVFAFYNLTDYAVDSTSKDLDWFLVNELVDSPALHPFVVEFFKEHPFIRTLYTIENNQEVEFPIPLIVYHASPVPTRQIDPIFGYVYKLVGTVSNEEGFTHPYILFPPPLNKTFFLLKKEFQEIAVESLDAYHDAFLSHECIRYVEKGVTVWIVKDVLACFPHIRREPDTAAAAAESASTVSFLPTKTTTSSLTNPHIRTDSTRSKTPSAQLQKSTYPTESTYDPDFHASRLLNPGKDRSFQGIK